MRRPRRGPDRRSGRGAKEIVPAKQVLRSDAKIRYILPQYHLQHRPEYYFLPVTPLQATKLNAAVAQRKDPDGLLSPSQLALKNRLAKLVKSGATNRKALAGALKPHEYRLTGKVTLAAYAAGLSAEIARLEKLPAP